MTRATENCQRGVLHRLFNDTIRETSNGKKKEEEKIASEDDFHEKGMCKSPAVV